MQREQTPERRRPSAEMEIIHTRCGEIERRIGRIEDFADKQKILLETNTSLTKETLDLVRNGKLITGIIKWVMSLAVGVAAIATYIRGH